MVAYEYDAFEVSLDGAVITVRFQPLDDVLDRIGWVPLHWELGDFFSRVRGDDRPRVVVLEGSEGSFLKPPSGGNPKRTLQLQDPVGVWKTFTGVIRLHQAMVELEKPIVAKVNGDAVGLGSSLALASDFVIAAEHVMFWDHHLGMDVGGTTPSNGGVALMPLYLPPTRAKEYLMLAKRMSAVELERLGVVNYCVPIAELDSKVETLVSELLSRPPLALGHTKRMINKIVTHHLNMTLEGAVAWGIVDGFQHRQLAERDFDSAETPWRTAT